MWDIPNMIQFLHNFPTRTVLPHFPVKYGWPNYFLMELSYTIRRLLNYNLVLFLYRHYDPFLRIPEIIVSYLLSILSITQFKIVL